MGLEAANYINELVETNPTGSDPASSADDHLRLIKKALRQTFPNITGPVTVTQGALNTPRVAMGIGPGQGASALSLGWGTGSEGGSRPLLSVDGVAWAGLAADWEMQAAAPPGLLGFFFQSALPGGWLKANGAAVSRTTFVRLFGRIGTTYGAGDGSTTFNLPDMRGLFARAWDDGRGIDSGRDFGSFQASANQAHTHGVNDAGHSHGLSDPTHTHGASSAAAGGHDHDSGWTRNGVIGGGGSTDGIGGGSYTGNVGISGYASQSKTSAVSTHTHGVTVTAASTGLSVVSATTGVSIQSSGTEAHPSNLALVACIKY